MQKNYLALTISCLCFTHAFSQIKLEGKIDLASKQKQILSLQNLEGSNACALELFFLDSANIKAGVRLELNTCSDLFLFDQKKIIFNRFSSAQNNLIHIESATQKYHIELFKNKGMYLMQRLFEKDNPNKIYHIIFNNTYVSQTPANKPCQDHIVKKGEYIYQIARKYNVSPSVLMQRNNKNAQSVLKPGERLSICQQAAAKQIPPKKEKKQTPLSPENYSYKVYAQEAKKEYELVLKEYNLLKKSYDALSLEYTENNERLKYIETENKQLKALLEKNNIAFDLPTDEQNNEKLSPEELENIAALRGRINHLKTKVNQMKNDIEIDDSSQINKTQTLNSSTNTSFQTIVNQMFDKLKTNGFHNYAFEKRMRYILSQKKPKKIIPSDLINNGAQEISATNFQTLFDSTFMNQFLTIPYQIEDNQSEKIMRLYAEVKTKEMEIFKKQGQYIIKKPKEDKGQTVDQNEPLYLYLQELTDFKEETKKEITVSFAEFELKAISEKGGFDTFDHYRFCR